MNDPFSPRRRHTYTDYLHARIHVFLVAYVGYAVCYLVRNNFKFAQTAFELKLSINAVTIGTILTIFALTYGLGKLLMGILVDRTSMQKMLVLSLTASGIICLLLPSAEKVWILQTLMGLLGIAQGASSPAALAMIGSWYPNRERGMYVTIWNTSQNVGAALLAFGASAIFAHTDAWPLIFWIPAIISFLCAWWIHRSIADRPWQEGFPTLQEMYGRAGMPHSDLAQEDSYWQLLISALRTTPVLWLLIILNSLLYFLRFGVINWMPQYLQQAKPLLSTHPTAAIAWLELGAVPAVLIFAFFAYKFPAAMSNVGAASMLLLGVTIVCYQYADSQFSVQLTAFAIGALVYAPQVVVNVLTLNLIPTRMAGAAVGLVGMSGYLIGEVAANLLLPRIALAAGWHSAYTFLVLLALISCFVYLLLRPYERRAVVLEK